MLSQGYTYVLQYCWFNTNTHTKLMDHKYKVQSSLSVHVVLGIAIVLVQTP